MKKLLTLALVAFSATVLAGCSSSTPTDEAVAPVVETTGAVETTPAVEAPVVEAATGTEAVEVTGAVATGN